MTNDCRVTSVMNSPKIVWFQVNIMGGSVLYAPFVCGSVHIDDLSAVCIVVICAPLPLC